MPDTSYDLIVIGAGPGGYVAAIRAAQLGLKTALVEKNGTLGGTCLNIGCIPSKALLASSEHAYHARHHLADHGVLVENVKVDLGKMMKRKENVVSNLTKGIQFLMKKNKVDVFQGIGRLEGTQSVSVEKGKEKQTLSARYILLATGSVPIELPFLPFDGKRVISSDQGIALTEVPKSLLVIGAGAIGLELGSVWSRLGTKVDVIEFLPRIAPGFDLEVATSLQKSLEKQGLSFHLGTQVKAGKIKASSVELQTLQGETEKKFEAEIVLVAIGRRPYSEGLGLETAGIQLTERKRVAINHHWQTSVPNIYAIGDLVDGPMLAHKAEEEGVAVAEHLAGKPGHVNYQIIPGVIYTSPELASVGLTEEAAKKQNISYKVGKFPFSVNGRALASGATEGLVKIIADAKTDRILGVHIVASIASELISEAVTIMEFSGSAEDLARTIHAHPTMSEVMKEAALAVDQRAIHS